MIGFIGGTGPEGKGLALRMAMAGENIIIGSREQEKGKLSADSLTNLVGQNQNTGHISGGSNKSAAQKSDVVFIAVPYPGHKKTLTDLKDHLHGKIIINVVVPLSFNKGRAISQIVPEGSVAEQSQEILKDSPVVGAFHNISAEDLLIPNKSIDSDVIVCSDDKPSQKYVMDLAQKIKGLRAIDGGVLSNSRYVEDFTAILININKIYKTHSSIKITGL
jgi:NADPH-dependent F420 reductase